MGKQGSARSDGELPRETESETDTTAGAGSAAARGEQEAALANVRSRVWELHLRGMPRARIAEQVGLHRVTVGRYIAACLREQMGAEQRQKREQMLAAAVARMRAVQQQAWADHDADDERERAVLERVGVPGGVTRYQSQRAQYLRVVLDAEREIARLVGLYEVSVDEGVVVFRIERVAVSEHVSGDGAVTVSTVPHMCAARDIRMDNDDGSG